jgi:hypothetical protein
MRLMWLAERPNDLKLTVPSWLYLANATMRPWALLVGLQVLELILTGTTLALVAALWRSHRPGPAAPDKPPRSEYWTRADGL